MLSGDTCSPPASIGPPQPTPTATAPARVEPVDEVGERREERVGVEIERVGASTRSRSVPSSRTIPAASLVPPTSTAMTSATEGGG